MIYVAYVLLFILFLSILIVVHELGHLLTAKMFNVYCFEYSIGFGPKLFSFKRKNGETYISLRAIPFGGFVSMYGEAESVPEGLEGTIDPSRSLLNIKRWKRFIILAAGVTMNFILAILMFFVYEVAFPTYTTRYAHVTIAKNSIAETVGLKSQDFVYAIAASNGDNSYIFYDNEALLTYGDSTTDNVYFGFSMNGMTIKDTSVSNHAVIFRQTILGKNDITTYSEYTVKQILNKEVTDPTLNIKTGGYLQAIGHNANSKKIIYSILQNFGEEDVNLYIYVTYQTDEEYKLYTSVPRGEYVSIIGNLDKLKSSSDGTEYTAIKIKDGNIQFKCPKYEEGNLLDTSKILKSTSFKTYIVDEKNYSGKGSSALNFNGIALSISGDHYVVDKNLGISMQLDQNMNSFGEAVRLSFVDFGNGATLIFRTLGELVTSAESWKNVGGILAVGVTTTRVLQEYGFAQFLFYWALISVNLGIVNLLPFPGLDGWQILVNIIEGITRKEIPPKVKGYVSIIGIALLFALMIIILIKDIISFI